MAEIEKLHRADVSATLAGDQAALAERMTDDIVILQQVLRQELRGVTGGADKHLQGKLLRVTRKQPDGAWKVGRAMWNTSD